MKETQDTTPDNVIEIEIVRRRHGFWPEKECSHAKVIVNEELSEISCRNCGAKLNPVVWLSNSYTWFLRTKEMRDSYVETKAALEKKRRCKCQHCGRITDIKSPTQKEIEVERNARIAEGRLVVVNSQGIDTSLLPKW